MQPRLTWSLTPSPNWYKVHLINVSESINQVNYYRTPTLIPYNPAQPRKKKFREQKQMIPNWSSLQKISLWCGENKLLFLVSNFCLLTYRWNTFISCLKASDAVCWENYILYRCCYQPENKLWQLQISEWSWLREKNICLTKYDLWTCSNTASLTSVCQCKQSVQRTWNSSSFNIWLVFDRVELYRRFTLIDTVAYCRKTQQTQVVFFTLQLINNSYAILFNL